MSRTAALTLRRCAFIAGLANLGLGGGTTVAAQAQGTAGAGQACGYRLGDAISNEWRDLGGRDGRLGCPTTDESVTSASPFGSAARQTTFGAAGTIVLHVSGPRAGQAYAVSGCLYKLYFGYGGPSGWLGLPVADAVNTPDGQRQAFEGGSMTFYRATDTCEAAPAPGPNQRNTPQ